MAFLFDVFNKGSHGVGFVFIDANRIYKALSKYSRLKNKSQLNWTEFILSNTSFEESLETD